MKTCWHAPCHRLFTCVNACLVLALLLSACESVSLPGQSGTPTPGRTNTPTTATSVPMPSTQTGCPAEGSARAAVIAPLAPGNHPTLVYSINEYQQYQPASGLLKRYDLTTRYTTGMVKSPGGIDFAQVSADGQWVVFVSYTPNTMGLSKLQLIRLDGQGLQTLYCSHGVAIQSLQQSPDQKTLAFAISDNGQEKLSLLTLSTGQLRTILTVPTSDGIVARSWLSTTGLFLTDIPHGIPSQRLYLLDLNKEMGQHLSDLTVLVKQPFGDFDSDGTRLYVNYGLCGQGGCKPPGEITVQPVTGGTQSTIFKSHYYDTVTVRAATAHNVLVMIRNDRVDNTNADMSHNGLWKMNSDGTGLTRLTTEATSQVSKLNGTSQSPWSNVSREKKLYAFQILTYQDSVETTSLAYGSLSGGTPTTFATISDGAQASIGGWTTW